MFQAVCPCLPTVLPPASLSREYTKHHLITDFDRNKCSRTVRLPVTLVIHSFAHSVTQLLTVWATVLHSLNSFPSPTLTVAYSFLLLPPSSFLLTPCSLLLLLSLLSFLLLQCLALSSCFRYCHCHWYWCYLWFAVCPLVQLSPLLLSLVTAAAGGICFLAVIHLFSLSFHVSL